MKDHILKYVALCCLCVRTRPLTAEMLSEQGTLMELQTGPDVDQSLASADYVKVQNVSMEAAVQKLGAQVSSRLSMLIRIPLNLSPNSVDDMYYGCSQKMLIKVKRFYLPKSTREGLYDTYTKLCAIKAMKNKDIYDPLSWNHFKALCAYTAGSYDSLNQAVRTGKSTYKTSFQFHALHFLLSDAIRLLKLNQRGCYTTYRRSKLLFEGAPGQIIRFGSFASSSLDKDLRHFGRTTCFEIHTCYGAYLKAYSEFDADEDEVLIPPYEMFRIVSVDMSGENHLRCGVFYKLETAGVYSSLNCQDVAGV
ncbi:NAD(P)(+)--arginine ADP-ribosyltransferase 2-like [Betta splendens]|uniref:NAD(P)(+)--arginine ADP-ribosyltransferase n=1 Tax=Betta splendens TaxID=158456 RepID=A0A6P7NHW7_BETSP|nr:NAD(P)(+)--arginine ADP-ribosyltransferase 2-like [Betta splendens]